MRILVLNPFAGEMREVERCRSVARPETDIAFENIAGVYPLNYVTYIYYRHRCADAVAERALRAEREGFDGARTLDVARRCVEEDGAEAILMGCTLQSCPLTVAGEGSANGAPIVDPVLVGLKTAEFMVELARVGLPTVSRYGTWQKPPAD